MSDPLFFMTRVDADIDYIRSTTTEDTAPEDQAPLAQAPSPHDRAEVPDLSVSG